VVEEGVDDRAVPALDHAQRFIAGDLAHETHAPRAHDAAVTLVEDVAAEVVTAEDALRLDRAPVLAPLLRDVVLELALAGLVADRAVERVVDQVELEDAGASGLRLLALSVDHLPVGHLRDARGRQLRHPFDLDQAHAALGRRRKPRVVAIVRDPDARPLGGLDDPRPLRHLDLHAVDRAGDRILLLVGSQRSPPRSLFADVGLSLRFAVDPADHAPAATATGRSPLGMSAR